MHLLIKAVCSALVRPRSGVAVRGVGGMEKHWAGGLRVGLTGRGSSVSRCRQPRRPLVVDFPPRGARLFRGRFPALPRHVPRARGFTSSPRFLPGPRGILECPRSLLGPFCVLLSTLNYTQSSRVCFRALYRLSGVPRFLTSAPWTTPRALPAVLGSCSTMLVLGHFEARLFPDSSES